MECLAKEKDKVKQVEEDRMKIVKEKDKIQQQFADIQQASEEVGQRVWNVFMMLACL